MPEQVCAVVVTYNRYAMLQRCLSSLLQQRRPPDAILVVDNASTDGTPARLAEAFPQVQVHRLAQNLGSSGGFHVGMQEAYAQGFDWLWIMDDDVAAQPNCLQELMDVSEETGKLVVVPRRLLPDGQVYVREAVIDETAQRYFGVEVDVEQERMRPIDIFTFEGPLIHHSVVERVGLPHPHLFIGADDYIYAARIYRAIGPQAGLLAARAIIQKQRYPQAAIRLPSKWKRRLTGRESFEVYEDAQHWRQMYTLRNRHLLWHELGWRRRRLEHLLLHLGFIGVDLAYAVRHGWNWPLRLKGNLTAWFLGLFATGGRFLDPARYRQG